MTQSPRTVSAFGPVHRRTVLRAVAIGAASLLFLGRGKAPAMPADGPRPEAGTLFRPDLALAIDLTGAVHLTVRKVEMGQGAHLGLRSLVAVELDVDPDRITVIQASSDPAQGQILTGGSYTLAAGWQRLRPVAAAARLMLIRAGAARWGVDAAILTTASGFVRHPDGRRLDYGALVPDAARQPVPAMGEATPHPPERFPVSATAVTDPLHARVATGELRYGIDLRLPGMLYASIERTPVVGGRVAALEDGAARRVPGVVDVIPLAGNRFPAPDHVRAGVAVLATNSWAAQKGREALRITWDEGTHAAFDSAAWMAELQARAEQPGIPCRTRGPDLVPPAAAGNLISRYDFPYIAHAPLEPPNALAWVRDGRAEVWTGTQRQRRLHDALAAILDLPGDRVLVHAPPLGGGFGRKLEVEYGIEAALLSRAAGRPVQVLWTREDDMTRSLYRPASTHRMEGRLDGQGRLAGVAHRFVGDSVFRQQDPGQIGPDGADFSMVIPLACWGYAVETLRFEHVPMLSPVPVAWWRGTAATTAAVANECFMDEMAALAGADPLSFRLRHLPPGHVSRAAYGREEAAVEVAVEADLMRRVLLAAAERAGWAEPPGPGRFRGIAAGFYDCDATYTAAVAEVSAGPGGPRIHRIVIASDSGLVVNPGTVAAQLVGNAVFALGSVMGQEITLERGRVRQTGFGDFPLPALADLPVIDPVILDSTRPPSGIGEPATPVVTAALMNALSAALGRRVRALPLRP